MENPFKTLDAKLSHIQELLLEIKHPTLPPEIDGDELLTVDETANLLKVGKTTLHRWAKTGKLKQRGLGGRIYYKKSEVIDAVKPLS